MEEDTKRSAAAVDIQRVMRGRFGRVRACKMRVLKHRRQLQKRYDSREEIFKYYFEQVGAAIRIQVI